MSDGAANGGAEGTVLGGASAAADATDAGADKGAAAGDGKGAAAAAEPKADAKTAEKAAEQPKPVEWEKWSPKAVEGLKRDDAVLKQFRELGKKHGLSAEQGQALVDFSDGLVRSQAEADLQHLEQTRRGWQESLKSDKEYGGANLKATHADVERAMKKFGEDPELRDFLNETGIGDHPGLIKLMARVGKAMREDKVPHDSQPTSQKQTLLDQLYGSPSSKS